MQSARMNSVEWSMLSGERPRSAGSNARLGAHGKAISVPLVRLQTDDGATGFGLGRPSLELAQALLGRALSEVFDEERGVLPDWQPFEYAIWDLVARQAGRPVYQLAAALNHRPVPQPYRVPCYDTSLYFDDLHLTADPDAAALIADEAREGYARGHRAFKIKVGRGARHMPIRAGTNRDIAVIHAVRDAVGSACSVMIDANNGYTLNLAKSALQETAECQVLWLEEAFHEDHVLYQDLRAWMAQQGLSVLIADGEGDASPRLLDWAQQGLIDVVQYDIAAHGFSQWLATGRRLDTWQVRSAPHHYGLYYGNYAACHLAAAIGSFAFVEWDEATVPGLAAPGYTLSEGLVNVPATPGFGLRLDDEAFRHAVAAGGYRYTA
jgi:L-rhamnonate dehydratase